jgi:hypothetical protein
MGIQRGPCTQGILLTACLAFAVAAHAACTAPQELTAKLRAQPTTENAIQLGSWFAAHKQFDCAVDTFRTPRNPIQIPPSFTTLKASHY